MKISARNQMKGKVIDIETEEQGLIAKVKIQVEQPSIVTAVITKEAADILEIKTDDTVLAVIKATEVMVGKEWFCVFEILWKNWIFFKGLFIFKDQMRD